LLERGAEEKKAAWLLKNHCCSTMCQLYWIAALF